MEEYEYAVTMNNDGVTGLRNSDAEATDSLREAFDALFDLLFFEETTDLEAEYEDDGSVEGGDDGAQGPRGADETARTQHSQPGRSGSIGVGAPRRDIADGNCSCIHRAEARTRETLERFPFVHQQAFVRGIHLPFTTSAYAQDAHSNATFALAVVVFNMAVASHRSSFQGDTRLAEERILNAQSLYFWSHTIMYSLPLSVFTPYGFVAMYLISLVIYNNLAQTSYVRSNFVETQLYLELLLVQSEIGYRGPSGPDGSTARILAMHKSYILENALSLLPPHFAPAA